MLVCRKKEGKVGALVIILGDYPWSVSVLYSGQHSKYTIYAPLYLRRLTPDCLNTAIIAIITTSPICHHSPPAPARYLDTVL